MDDGHISGYRSDSGASAMKPPTSPFSASDREWIAYNKYLSNPVLRKKRKEADALVAKLCQVFGGYVESITYEEQGDA
jgi:hypothetical protein